MLDCAVMEVTNKQLLNRGVEQVLPSREYLESRLNKGEKLKIYLGIDPTGPTLHLGHAIALQKMSEFQALGHEVTILIGDFTAQIGDPTGKDSVRKPLTPSDIKKNLKLYKKQLTKFLRFSGRNKAKIAYNSSWFNKMRLADVLKLSSLMTVEQMLKRDMFDNRTKDGKPIFIHEFMYPLMQGYDSVILNVDGEVGGNDQLFNMLVGRDFQKKVNNKEKFTITMKLLVDSFGKKMGKTENNGVLLTDSADEMFGKIMSWTDSMIVSGFELCTFSNEEKINSIKKELEEGVNPRDLKVRLAKEIITFYYSEADANKAEENFINTFQKGGVPEDIKEVVGEFGDLLSKIAVASGEVSSMNEYRRLLMSGAVSINGEEKITDLNYKIENDLVVKIGKRRFLKINIK